MTSEGGTWRVGMIGVTPTGLYLLEQLVLSEQVSLVGVFDRDASRLRLAAASDRRSWDSAESMIASKEIDDLFLMDVPSADFVSAALHSGKNIVLDRPWQFSSDVLQELDKQAATAERIATAVSLRRWSADLLNAGGAIQSGRIGTLQRVRMSSCVQTLTTDATNFRELCFHWVDQLLVLVDSTPRHVFSRGFGASESSNEDGFLAVIEFANGCTTQIEVQTQSRLSHRTGWMLEGSKGSFWNNRLFTTMSDGEIVDEPLEQASQTASPFLAQLISAWRGEPTTLPTLGDAARTVQLIELIVQSSNTGNVVRR